MRTKLQEARKSKKLTQSQAGDHLGITKNAYQAVELGTRDGSVKNWLKLFELFDKEIPLDELMQNT